MARLLAPLVMLAVAAGCFPYSLWALSRRDDLVAALVFACGALMTWALQGSVRLLDP